MEVIWNPDDYSIEDLVVLLTEKVGKPISKAGCLVPEKTEEKERNLKIYCENN
jgi:hypothetical protein